MKKTLLIMAIILLSAIVLLALIYYNLPVMKIKQDYIAEIGIMNFHCDKLRDTYEVVCETGNKELDILCFVVKPGEEFNGTVIVNRSPEKEILVYTRDNRDLVKTFSFPNPGTAKRTIAGASRGRIYYLEWDSKINQTDLKYFQVIIRKVSH